MLPVRAAALEAVFASGDGIGPLDLRVGPGEAVLVLGPSGCGKSTLLRCLTGAVPHAVDADVSGELQVCGTDVATGGVAAATRHVGVLAQDPETGVCLPEVADELALGLENRAVDPALIAGAVHAALATVAASDLIDRQTTDLSGGELQRVALAAAVVTGPALLVLDEPTSMLDASGVVAVRRAVDAAQRATGAAVVLVEHRLDEYAGDDGVAGLPARTVVLDRNGRVVADGPSVEVFDRFAALLLAGGCWLPLEAELRALFGELGELGSATVRRCVRRLRPISPAPPPPPPPPAEDTGPTTSPAGRPSPAGPSPEEALVLVDGALTARGVGRGSRRRRPPVLLEGLDVRLERGELVALVGRNGSGKSTLLRCLAGLHPPVSGRLTGPRAGLVFQNPEHQFTQTTVRAEVATGLRPGAPDRVEAALAGLGLVDLAGHHPFRLSGGQQRRLSLAAMLVHDRPFLLADEPGFGLDRHTGITVMRALAAACREGRGVLFSSHDLRALCGYADRVLVLADGRLLADTTPLALLRSEELLVAAGLSAPRLLRWLREEVADDAGLAAVLRGLDDLTLPVTTPVEGSLPVGVGR